MRLLHQARSEVSALETSGGGRRGPEVGGGEGIATRAMAPSQKGSPNIGCKRLLQHPLMCSHTPAHFPAACSKNTKLAGGASLVECRGVVAQLPRATIWERSSCRAISGRLSPLAAIVPCAEVMPARLAVVASPRRRPGCRGGAGCGGGAGDAAL